MPLAVALILGGMALALIPGLPVVELEPELALALFLPPLLQLSAYRTDWPAFKLNLRPIMLLAVGGVFFTALCIAAATKLLVPDLPWWAAITLGAIVAPPDAVAAAAVLKQVKLPRRLVTVLEGESLINDASSLVLYRFAVAATIAAAANAGAEVSYGQGALEFFGGAIGGTVIGLVAGYLAMRVFAMIEDTLLDITVSILAGYAAYFASEAVHVSGVLAAVACGYVLGRKQHAAFTAKTRLDLMAVWNFIEFVLTAMVFMLIGSQLRGIIERLERYDTAQLALLGAVVSLTLIASRFVWVFPSVWLPRALSRSLRERDPMPPWSHATILSWAGMRGVVSMAAALALPAQFPGRDIILFLAFCAILATLMIQGTTLAWLITRLRVTEADSEEANANLARARAEVSVAALKAVESHVGEQGRDDFTVAADELVEEYRARADLAHLETEGDEPVADQVEAQQRLRLIAIEGARSKLDEHTDTIDTESHRALGEELDLEEQQIRNRLGEVQ